MKRAVFIIILIMGFSCVSCRQSDMRTMKIHVPEMKNRACATIVGKAVSGLPGVLSDKIVIDLAARTVTVTFESLVLGLKNIEIAIAEAGFTADDVPAKPDAEKKLPAECKSP